MTAAAWIVEANNGSYKADRTNETSACTFSWELFQPLAVFDPDAEPDAGDGVDGIAKYHLAVFVEVLTPLGLLHELLHGLGVLEGLRNEVVREQVGVLRNGTHKVPCVVVVASPTMGVFACGYIILNIHDEGCRFEWQGITVWIVEEAVVVLVNLVGLINLVFPLLFDGSVDAFLVGEWTTVAMQRHVTVGYVVTEDEETHGNVVACGSDWTASVLAVQHLEVVDDAVGNGLATVGAIASNAFVGLVEQWRGFPHQFIDAMSGGKFVEGGIRTVLSGLVFDDVAGGHVLEHLIRIPSSLDYEVTIVLEPSDKCFSFLADIFADTFDNGFVVSGGDDFQSFDSHKSYPSM